VHPAKPDFLIRLSGLVGADLDRDLTIQPLEKIEQLVGGETVEMPVHQVGDFRLFDPEQGSDFLLFEISVFEQFIDMKSKFRTCK